jgi:hypothetical protein
MNIPMITPSEVNWVREQIEDILLWVYQHRKAGPYRVDVTPFRSVDMPPLDADAEPPVINEELLERCLLSNNWYHSDWYRKLDDHPNKKINWGEQATNLLAMKARGISYRRCGEHFGVSPERARSVEQHGLFRLRDLALLGRLTQEPTPSVWARIKAKISGG